MEAFDFDLLVIGAGSGGVRCARIAAGHGAKVAVAEAGALGGTCVNVGCVPKKLFVYASEYSRAFRDAQGFGWTLPTTGIEHDFGALVAAKDAEIERLGGVYERLLRSSGVTLLRGRAQLLDAHRVQVEAQQVAARYIVLAPGSRPFVPEIPGCDLAVTSNDLFFLPETPKRVLFIGGGYIAVEFAGIFHGLGADVVVACRGGALLRGFDHDVQVALSMQMAVNGIDLRFGVEPVSIEVNGAGRRVAMQDGSTIDADLVVMATGRVPNIDGLGLSRAGVDCGASGAVVVDANSRTSVPNIYAVGDVTDRMQLTPVAIAEGHAVADALFGTESRALDYATVPSAVFSQPQVGTVGLTEAEARKRYGKIRVYRSDFKAMKHTLSGRDERTMMKLVVDDASDRVVGCHMVGPEAGEVIQGFAVALKCGATKRQFDATVGIHPTAAEEFVTMRTARAEP